MSAICIIYRMLCQTLSPTSFRLKKKQIKTNKKSGKEERRNKLFEDIQFRLCYGKALSRHFVSWILPCYIIATQPRVFQRINSALLRCLSIGWPRAAPTRNICCTVPNTLTVSRNIATTIRPPLPIVPYLSTYLAIKYILREKS